MSVISNTSEGDSKIMEIMKSIFTVDYTLDEKDREFLNRIIAYGQTREGLPKKEMDILKKTGFIDPKDNTFLVPEEFWFNSIVLPAYWLKCLMAYHGMLSIKENTKEPSETPNGQTKSE